MHTASIVSTTSVLGGHAAEQGRVNIAGLPLQARPIMAAHHGDTCPTTMCKAQLTVNAPLVMHKQQQGSSLTLLHDSAACNLKGCSARTGLHNFHS